MDSPYTEDKFVIHYKNYVKPKDLEEAFALNAGKSAVIAGGFCFLRLQQKNIGTLLDLKELLSDQIEETGDGFRIGAMVSLRQIYQSRCHVHRRRTGDPFQYSCYGYYNFTVQLPDSV